MKHVKFWREAREWIVSIAVAVAVVLLLQNFLFTLIRVDGNSMNPTLANAERLFVNVAQAKFGEVNRGEVVICHYPDRGNTFFVKRVLAVPGDTIYRTDGVTHVIHHENGSDVPVDPDWKTSGTYRPSPDFAPTVLQEGEYYVVGDNRYNSNDSRKVGPISRDMITGVVRQVVWPLNQIRPVE